MKKNSIIAIVIIILVIVGVAVAEINNNSGTKTTNTGDTTTTTDKSSDTTTPQPIDKVSIENMAFAPDSIAVKMGTAVTWTNKDSTAHTVTESDSQTGPNSGDLTPGKSYTFTFNTAGTFHYHCTIHPDMIGTVTVTQ